MEPDTEAYVCDLLAFDTMMSSLEEKDSSLGVWVQCQLDAGELYLCTDVDAAGWRCGLPSLKRNLASQTGFIRCSKSEAGDAIGDDALHDTVAAYLQTHSLVEDGPYRHLRRFITGNRRILETFMSTVEQRDKCRFAFGAAGGGHPISVVWVLDAFNPDVEGL